MLVKDLRKIINNYSLKEKDDIIVELYKRIPKRVKEDYDIDEYLSNIRKSKETKKEVKKLTIDDLSKQVNYFVECAYSDLYVVPNKIISKKERPKWRFVVKKFYKELNSFDPTTIDGAKATDLLKDLYKILSLGTVTLKFSNWETFKAIGVSQSEFAEKIVQRKLANDTKKEEVSYCLDLLDMEFDPYEYHASVLHAIASSLPNIEAKRMATLLLKEKVVNKKAKLKEVKKNFDRSYYLKQDINYALECLFYISFDLDELDKFISYYHKEYIEPNKEVKEYIILDWLSNYDLTEEWLKEYESHTDIDYRSSLKEQYETIKKKVK